jgi:hypothetical protein
METVMSVTELPIRREAAPQPRNKFCDDNPIDTVRNCRALLRFLYWHEMDGDAIPPPHDKVLVDLGRTLLLGMLCDALEHAEGEIEKGDRS